MTRPDETGRLTTGEYVPGPYMIRVFGLPTGWSVQSATAGGKDAIDRLFELPATGVTDLVITIANRQSQVAGMVRDANGQPAPLATVIVFPVDKSMWPVVGIPSRRAVLIAPGRDGRYRVTGLPAGEYVVAASEAASFDLSDARLLTSLAGYAQHITLNEAESRTLDLVVRR